jgi:hypothetical protein
MNQRIIYPTDNDGVAVIIPAPECGLTIEEIAAKDVPPIVVFGPEGSVLSSSPRPFKIVDVTDLPSDRTDRATWEYANIGAALT